MVCAATGISRGLTGHAPSIRKKRSPVWAISAASIDTAASLVRCANHQRRRSNFSIYTIV